MDQSCTTSPTREPAYPTKLVLLPPPEPQVQARVGAATRAGTMPPPKENFFNVRAPPGTSVDEVIDALEALVGTPEIYSVQRLGVQDFQVGVKSL
ncbi:hypothetical protein HPB50_014044 [Hyalomma asiaticum]|uniref:Uncharacterized protein n=1 Tax=Hyalomma asiaticum TaxID=266040 RepID=A0ACB7TI06_HYAAI|nr:hypothetical protein HPB50_014044 [Hyalomma asiaticum]